MKAHKEYAWHIMDEINFIKSNCSMLSYEAFLADEVLKRAVIRSLEIIGEAVKKIPAEVIAIYPATAWKNIAGMRDRLIHHYFGVDYFLVWDVLRNHLAQLEKDIHRILAGP